MKQFLVLALLFISLSGLAQSKTKTTSLPDTSLSKNHHAIYDFNEDQMATLYQALQVTIEKLPESDVLSARGANKVGGFTDSLSRVLMTQLVRWNPPPKPIVAPKKDSVQPKAP